LTSSEEEIRDPLMAKVAGLLLSLIVRTLFLTGRKRFMGEENLVGFMKTGTPVIIASWHNRLAITPFNYLARAARGRRLWPIASASKDGAIAAWGLRFLGLKCVRGSSSRHGTRALRQMIRIMRAGDDLAFTPDGPRGPRHSVAEGVLLAAKLSGAPIVPLSFGAKRHKRLKTWDRMLLPFPFTRLNLIYGTPIYVPKQADEAAMAAIADELRQELLRIGEASAQFE